MPGLPAWSNEAMIDELLHHTGAIPVDKALLAAGHDLTERTTQQAIVAIAGIHSLDHRLRGMSRYSDPDYVLLAEVIAPAAQQPLPEQARANVFQPLALDMVIDPLGGLRTPPRNVRGAFSRCAGGRPWWACRAQAGSVECGGRAGPTTRRGSSRLTGTPIPTGAAHRVRATTVAR